MLCDSFRRTISCIMLVIFMAITFSINVFASEPPFKESRKNNTPYKFNNFEEESVSKVSYTNWDENDYNDENLSNELGEKEESFEECNSTSTVRSEEYDFEYSTDEAATESNNSMVKDSCGDGVKYSFYEITGELIISGKGKINNFSETMSEYSPWHKYNNSIISVVIEDGVTEIGNAAFYDCKNLVSVTIPDSVTKIGRKAFKRCGNLISVVIPNSVIEVGREAFEGCGGLKSVTLSNKITSINYMTFGECESLISVVIPNNVTKIGCRAFRRCGNLESVTIPNGLKIISEKAFESCGNLKSITIPANVTTIENKAFRFCRNLVSITLPSNIKELGINAFACCKNLNSVTYLGINEPYNEENKSENNVFYGSPVEKVMVPINYKNNSFCSIEVQKEKYALQDKLKGSCGDGVEYVFNVNTGELIITGIGEMADYNYYPDILNISPWDSYKEYITSVTIAEGVTSIGCGAFYDCKNLTCICIPSSVTKIDNFAFSGCIGLKSLNIANNITHIGESAFWGCKNLISVTIPEKVCYIENHAFACCENLKTVTYCGTIEPEVEKNLGKCMVFSKCSKLSEIEVPAEYSGRSFCGKKVLKSSTSTNDSKIQYEGRCGSGVRYSFNKLTGRLTIFGAGEMTNYSYSLNNQQKCFPWDSYKSDIKSLVIKKGVTSIGSYTFYRCDNLKSICIPESVKNIGCNAFCSCKNLITVKIPDGVSKIDNSAFKSCLELKSVIIPASVNEIGENAFRECVKLNSITYLGTTEPACGYPKTVFFVFKPKTDLCVKVCNKYEGTSFLNLPIKKCNNIK